MNFNFGYHCELDRQWHPIMRTYLELHFCLDDPQLCHLVVKNWVISGKLGDSVECSRTGRLPRVWSNINSLQLKRTVSVISCNPSCRDSNTGEPVYFHLWVLCKSDLRICFFKETREKFTEINSLRVRKNDVVFHNIYQIKVLKNICRFTDGLLSNLIHLKTTKKILKNFIWRVTHSF